MKKIGFIDYYISEWHANNYPNWIKEINDEYCVAYAWAEIDVSPVDNITTDEWCEKFGAEKCETIQELCEKSDYIVILSPAFPEKHLEYAKVALTYGKTTYIDKPFSDSGENAEKIYEIASKYSTPIFSSSALRYADELKDVTGRLAVSTRGSGRSIEEYIIHQAEMLVKTIGIGATEMKSFTMPDGQCIFMIKYPDERRGCIHYSKTNFSFSIAYEQDGATIFTSIKSDFFKNLTRDILRFFDTNEPSFAPAETIEVSRITAACVKCQNTPDVWIKI